MMMGQTGASVRSLHLSSLAQTTITTNSTDQPTAPVHRQELNAIWWLNRRAQAGVRSLSFTLINPSISSDKPPNIRTIKHEEQTHEQY